MGRLPLPLSAIKDWWQRPWRSEEPGTDEHAGRAPDATSEEVVVGKPLGFDGRPLPESKNLYGRGTGM